MTREEINLFNWTRSSSTNKKSVSEITATMKIEDFPKIFSRHVINFIVCEEKETNRKYVGGNFHINYLDDKFHSVSCELYFQDKDEEIFKTEGKSKPLNSAYLLPEARKELAEEKLITFEIPEPSKAERDVYSGDISLKNALKDIFDIFQPKK